MSEPLTGHDMSRYWRIVTNEGGLITGTWWVTRPDDRRGTSHVKPIDVVMWSEGKHHGLTLKPDDFTAFVTDGVVEPISVRAHHDYVTREAESRLPEIEAVVLAVIAAVDWPSSPSADQQQRSN
jgi:hypothetical protein